MKIAKCPSSQEHHLFVVNIPVFQRWIASENGELIRQHGEPDDLPIEYNMDGVWLCHTCGAEAVFEDDDQ